MAIALLSLATNLKRRPPLMVCRPTSAEYKLGKNIKIAMLYLEDEDAVSAEQYIKKASSLLAGCKVSRRPRCCSAALGSF